MLGIILTLVAALFIAGMALLAHFARKNRGAEVTLFITLLAASLLTLVVGVFIGIGLFFLAPQSGPIPQQAILTATGIAVALTGVIGTGLCVSPIIRIFRGPKTTTLQESQASEKAPWETLTGAASPAETAETRSFWVDPPTVLALWLFTLVLMNNVASILAFAIAPEVTTDAIAQAGQFSVGTVVGSQVPFIIVAIAGVGLFVARDFRGALSRLGYGAISAKQLGVVVLFIVGALGCAIGADRIFAALQPDLYRTVGDLSEALFSPQGMSPVTAVLFALLIGIGAGLGEETLFRGAVQPKLGIVLTSVLFASMHVQYGPSLLLFFIFLLSLALGYLRRRVNTTASFLAHAGYNTSSVLLAYFFGI